MTEFKQQMMPYFDGDKSLFCEFVKQYGLILELTVGGFYGAEFVQAHPLPTKKLTALKDQIKSENEKNPATKKGKTNQEMRLKNLNITYSKRKDQFETESIKAKAILLTHLTPDVKNNIEADIRRIKKQYLAGPNPHNLDNYFVLRATIDALELHYRPNITQALSDARSRLEREPIGKSIAEIQSAIKRYCNEIANYPVLKPDGSHELDADDNPKYHVYNEHDMRSTVKMLFEKSNDPNAPFFLNSWTSSMTEVTSKTMLNQIESHVRHSNKKSSNTTSTPAAPNTSVNATLPTASITSLANVAAYKHSEVHDESPLKVTPRAKCYNCKQHGHKTKDCGSLSCDTCKITFGTLKERQAHAADVHRSDRERPQHHSSHYNHHPRDRDYQNRGRSQYREDRSYRSSNDRRDERSRSRSRSRDNRSYNRQYQDRRADDRSRNRSPSNRADDRRRGHSSSHPPSAIRRSNNVSFSNAATYEPPQEQGHPHKRRRDRSESYDEYESDDEY
jgi:hypothetical protein